MTQENVELKKTQMTRAVALEREATQLLIEQQTQKAFEAYKRAGQAYEEALEFDKASVCYASAATCWNVLTGRQPLRNAAACSELAAAAAFKAKHYEYARSLYRDAAIFYEDEGDYDKYTECYLNNKLADRYHYWFIVAHPDHSFREKVESLYRLLLNIAGDMIWGYGEKPLRTFFAAAALVFTAAIVYEMSGLVAFGSTIKGINFFEALYFSVVTFTTVGYGDYLPTGWIRIVSSLESLSGIILAPMFLIALTRRYLRINR